MTNTNRLYKYRALNQNGLKILINQEVYFSKPEQLNDPLDYQLPLMRIIQSAIDGEIDPNLKEVLSFLTELKAMNYDTRKEENHIEKIENGLKDMGVLSLSRTPEDPLLWAHYANEHRGFCIGFGIKELSNHFKSQDIHGDDVVYKKNLAPLKDALIKTGKELLSYMKSQNIKCVKDLNKKQIEYFYVPLIWKLGFYCFRMKSEAWDYEEEFRFISNTPGVVSIPSTIIKEIIFGLKMDEDDKKTIKNIFASKKNNDVRYKEVVYSDDSFKFKVVDHPISPKKE